MAGYRSTQQSPFRAGATYRVPQGWSRRRILALLTGIAGLAGLLVWGLVLSLMSVGSAVLGTGHPDPVSATAPARAGSTSAQVARARDELAARPMPGALGDYKPEALSTRDPGTPIVLPPARGRDGVGVLTGYPKTTAGAIAQVAAIDQAAMQSGTLAGVRAVIAAWAAPGGPSPTTWSGVTSMAGLLGEMDLPGSGSPRLTITFTPSMGLVKGNVGSDFVVACVDFAVEVSLDETSTAAVADCERMLWQDGRWVIGPGTEPAEAPSFWPDTDEALEAGWKDLTHDQATHE